MRYTDNLHLALPDNTDLFRVRDINGNSEAIDEAFGGVLLKATTQQAYDAMDEHRENTIYVVHDGSDVKLYVGDTLIGGSTGE